MADIIGTLSEAYSFTGQIAIEDTVSGKLEPPQATFVPVPVPVPVPTPVEYYSISELTPEVITVTILT